MPSLRPAARPIAAVGVLAASAALLTAAPASAGTAVAPVWSGNGHLTVKALDGALKVSWWRLSPSDSTGATGGGWTGGSPVAYDHYVVALSANGTPVPGATCTAAATGSVMACTVSGLTNGTKYTAAVTATNDALLSTATAPSAATSPFGRPKAPTAIVSKAGYEQLTTTWARANGNGSPVTGYRAALIRVGVKNPVATRDVKSSQLGVAFKGLVAGAKYRVTVAARTAYPQLSLAATSNTVVPTLPPATKLPLRLGQRGPMVATLQQRLAWAGMPVHPNGKPVSTMASTDTVLFDKATQNQVKHLQEKFLLDQTGIVDQDTWSTLASITKSKGVLPSGCSGTAICISKGQRLLRYLVNGRIVLMTDVRFGPEDDPALRTRNGMHEVFSKSRWHVSSLYHTPMYYAMFFDGGQAVHLSKYFLADGYYGHSHGCVNVRDESKVAWLFDHVSLGTKVYIY